uniref:Uncharacterized protein n=1 Tax=Anguilla anguilla TaxID=7936 RepID=A0A0E9QH09_ANGAN
MSSVNSILTVLIQCLTDNIWSHLTPNAFTHGSETV